MKLCSFDVGLERPLFLIAGPCVVESEQLQIDVAGQLKEITGALGLPFIFKSSYDKANRSSGTSFRGPGMQRGLEILAKVGRALAVPVLTERHRHRYEANEQYLDRLADAGLVVSAITQREKLTEVVELPTSVHPWFVGVQFHPEFKSTPWGGHPLFKSFIRAALAHQAERAEKVAA